MRWASLEDVRRRGRAAEPDTFKLVGRRRLVHYAGVGTNLLSLKTSRIPMLLQLNEDIHVVSVRECADL